MNSPVQSANATPRPSLFFVAACIWVAVSLTAARLVALHAAAAYGDLVQQAVLAILLFGGFYAFAQVAVPDLRPLSSLGFVRRPGIGREFGLGLALGWAVAIALVLPALLTGNLHLGFSFDVPSILLTLRSAAVLALFSLVVQMIFAGLPARLLLRIAGAGWTAAASIFVACLLVFLGEPVPGRNLLFTVAAAAVFTAGFLRTRAAWLPLGLQAGWTIGLQLLFGTPSPYTPPAAGMVDGRVGGGFALTGGAFGPEASSFAPIILLVALGFLFRVTRDYAWHYTYQPITAAGYAMDVAPPAEHLREEQRSAAAAPLVQIGGLPASPVISTPSDSGQTLL